MKAYSEVTKVLYEGPKGIDPYTFKYFNPDEVIGGKPMREQLRFALSWWHTLCAEGADMFGAGTLDKSFGKTAPLEIFKAKADVAFHLMDQLSIDYYCFHDVDIAPEGETWAESLSYFDEMVNYLAELQKKHGKKLLWSTANNFSNKKFMAGAATTCAADVYAMAAAKVKAGLDAALKLGAEGYVFWGGREGYETLLNTDMALELDNLGRFMKMAVDYKKKIGFTGDFYIEPKPKEPTKHQYDFDAATCMNFLRTYGLEREFKLNLEANHATLAGHTFQHEIRTAAVNGAFGSIDANQGDLFLGWDTDQFPTNVYDATLAMYEIRKAGGFTKGGLNFDAKTRRMSNSLEDILLSYIAGMDTFALGLRKAIALEEDGRIEAFVKNRYRSFDSGMGAKIKAGTTSLEELANYAATVKEFPVESGRQEYLETVVNNVLFNG